MLHFLANIWRRFLTAEKLTLLAALLAGLGHILLTPVSLHAGAYSSGQVKAAMMIKFTDFITWPAQAFEDSDNSFVIGILGNPTLFGLLSAFEGRQIQGRPLRVIALETWEDDRPLHMIYLDSRKLAANEEFILADQRKYTLTVSDSEDFLAAGGMLSFITKKDGRLGFAVNRPVQLASGLGFSSALLRLASIRNGTGQTDQ